MVYPGAVHSSQIKAEETWIIESFCTETNPAPFFLLTHTLAQISALRKTKRLTSLVAHTVPDIVFGTSLPLLNYRALITGAARATNNQGRSAFLSSPRLSVFRPTALLGEQHLSQTRPHRLSDNRYTVQRASLSSGQLRLPSRRTGPGETVHGADWTLPHDSTGLQQAVLTDQTWTLSFSV